MSDLMDAMERYHHEAFIQELREQWYAVIGGPSEHSHDSQPSSDPRKLVSAGQGLSLLKMEGLREMRAPSRWLLRQCSRNL
jgi:hypothetical protein